MLCTWWYLYDANFPNIVVLEGSSSSSVTLVVQLLHFLTVMQIYADLMGLLFIDTDVVEPGSFFLQNLIKLGTRAI